MDIAVRWVYQQVLDRKGFHLEAGQKPSLCFKARKFMLCVAAGHPVRVLKRPAADFDKTRVVLYQGSEYTIAHAVAQFTAIGERNGITEGARKLLQRALEMVEDLDENEFNDEEEIQVKFNNEKTAEDVTSQETNAVDGGDTGAATANTTTTEETPVKAKRAKKDRPARAAKPKAAKAVKAVKAKGNGAARKIYTPSPDSKIGKAVAFMKDEVKKAGGVAKLERGFLKDLFERTSKKHGVATATASTQYNAQIRSK